MSGPLAGIKVVDMTAVGMGPYATQILGDHGAQVIKVETLGGDVFRHVEPKQSPGMSAPYLQLNRNKRSISLNLKQPKDFQFLLQLIQGADCLVSSIRPAAMKRLGLDYDSLAAAHPRLVYCGLYGYSESGPYAGQPAFDDVIQALSGTADLQSGRKGGAPAYVNTVLADKVAGLTAAYAIAMALFERTQSGRGQAVEVPMFETMVSFNLIEHMGAATFSGNKNPMGYERVLSSHRRPYQTKDGYIAILPYTTGQWKRFFEQSGYPQYADEPRFMDESLRGQHIHELYGILADIIRSRTTQEWLTQLADADIPIVPVSQLEDLLDDPHLTATGFFKTVSHPSEGDITLASPPVNFSRTPARLRSLPPTLNQDGAALRQAKDPWDFE